MLGGRAIPTLWLRAGHRHDLAARNIYHELRELVRVARAFGELRHGSVSSHQGIAPNLHIASANYGVAIRFDFCSGSRKDACAGKRLSRRCSLGARRKGVPRSKLSRQIRARLVGRKSEIVVVPFGLEDEYLHALIWHGSAGRIHQAAEQ